MAAENNNLVSIDKSTVIDLPQTNSVQNEKEPCINKSPSEFLNCRIAELKNSKSNAPLKKVRTTISKIASGKAVTETNITKQIIEHKSCQDNKNKCAKSSARKPSKRKSYVVKSKAKELMSSSNDTRCNNTHSPKAGPSNICLDSSFENDSEIESESQIDPKEKCCVCGLFYPQQVRENVSLIITKWVQCDNSACKHWVHLLFCTEINTAVRRGTKYFCEHCKNEFSED